MAVGDAGDCACFTARWVWARCGRRYVGEWSSPNRGGETLQITRQASTRSLSSSFAMECPAVLPRWRHLNDDGLLVMQMHGSIVPLVVDEVSGMLTFDRYEKSKRRVVSRCNKVEDKTMTHTGISRSRPMSIEEVLAYLNGACVRCTSSVQVGGSELRSRDIAFATFEIAAARPSAQGGNRSASNR